MADAESLPEPPQSSSDDVLEMKRDLERLIEDTENLSVQLTWMCYDMAALRTSPELWDSMQKLEEAHHKCRAVVCGDQEQEPEMGTCPELTVIATTQM
ncbi:synaptonemal complex central element protein 3 [Epinephelus lanceolatus]|uniref:synaptonemal complex central element protein 3 n=1 Tax=Epinephelus lanceolatus TaxID=310571 RepID=UPI001445283A|nr:synaptonemal complex central element protein 3 [Epinephelus lanceolatus]